MAIITSPTSPDLSAVACKAKEGGPFIMPLGASVSGCKTFSRKSTEHES